MEGLLSTGPTLSSSLVFLPAGDVPVKLPLLPKDGVAADVATLVAPLLLCPQVVLHSRSLKMVVTARGGVCGCIYCGDNMMVMARR